MKTIKNRSQTLVFILTLTTLLFQSCGSDVTPNFDGLVWDMVIGDIIEPDDPDDASDKLKVTTIRKADIESENEFRTLVWEDKFINLDRADGKLCLYNLEKASCEFKVTLAIRLSKEADLHLIDDVVCVISKDKIYGISLSAEEVLWSMVTEGYNSQYIEAGGTDFFISQISDENNAYQRARVLKINAYDGEDTVIDQQDDVTHIGPCIYVNTPGQSKILSYAYQLDHNDPHQCYIRGLHPIGGQVQWDSKSQNITYDILLNIPPVADYKNIIWMGVNAMQSIEATSGKKHWGLGLSSFGDYGINEKTEMLLQSGKLYFNAKGHTLICIDANTAQYLWSTEEINPQSRTIHYDFQHKVFLLISDYIYIIDAQTGEIIYEEETKDTGPYNRSVIYHQQSDMYYASTHRNIFSLKLDL